MNDELIACLPPEAVYHRVELPTDENAWWPWREAIASLDQLNSNYVDRILRASADSLAGDVVETTAHETSQFAPANKRNGVSSVTTP